MKFLQAAVLAAICVGYVIASHPGYVGYDGLRDAIKEGRLDIAVELVKQDVGLGKVGVEYVIEKDDPAFIANFVNQTNQANEDTLYTLWRKIPIENIGKVLDKTDFPQQAWVDVASSYVVVSRTDKFLAMLNKIVKPEDQEKAVEKAIEELLYSDAETVPLLDALKGKTLRSERLEYLAIQKAFMEGVKDRRVYLLPGDIRGHGAITPELYADALMVTAEGWGYGVRQFLLARADRYDLQIVKEKAGCAGLNAGFRDAIEEALKTAKPEGTRWPKYLVQSAKIAKETFDEITGKEFSGITDIIGSFLTGRPTTRERAKAVRQTIEEVTMTRTPQPTKEIGDILGAYVGEDEE